MKRYEAKAAIYEVVNSGIIDSELEDKLTEIASHICDDEWEDCGSNELTRCKLDGCLHAKE